MRSFLALIVLHRLQMQLGTEVSKNVVGVDAYLCIPLVVAVAPFALPSIRCLSRPNREGRCCSPAQSTASPGKTPQTSRANSVPSFSGAFSSITLASQEGIRSLFLWNAHEADANLGMLHSGSCFQILSSFLGFLLGFQGFRKKDELTVFKFVQHPSAHRFSH